MPERFNTHLETQLLRQGRTEKFGNKTVRVFERDPQLSLAVAGMRRMFDEDPREKVSPEGVIYISRYIDRKNDKELDESQLEREASKEVERLWIPFPHGYPSVIRGTGKIEAAYLPGGKEYEVNRVLRNHLAQTLREFQRGNVRTRDEYEELCLRTADVVVSTRLDTARKPEKQEVFYELIHALSATDSLDRFNPSRSRWSYNFALAKLQPLFFFEPYPREKYGALRRKTLWSYRAALAGLDAVKEALRDFGNTPARSPEYQRMAQATKRVVAEFTSDSAVPANPLHRAALLTRFGILGPQTGHEIFLIQEYGKERVLADIYHEQAIEFEMGGRRLDIIQKCIGEINEAQDEAEQRLAGTFVENPPKLVVPSLY